MIASVAVNILLVFMALFLNLLINHCTLASDSNTSGRHSDILINFASISWNAYYVHGSSA